MQHFLGSRSEGVPTLGSAVLTEPAAGSGLASPGPGSLKTLRHLQGALPTLCSSALTTVLGNYGARGGLGEEGRAPPELHLSLAR